MKVMTILLLCVSLFLASCGENKQKAPNSQSAPAAPTGRLTTRGIKAASILGYDSVGMRRSIDKALDQNDAKNAEEKKALDQASQQ